MWMIIVINVIALCTIGFCNFVNFYTTIVYYYEKRMQHKMAENRFCCNKPNVDAIG